MTRGRISTSSCKKYITSIKATWFGCVSGRGTSLVSKANSLVAQVLRHLPFIEATGGQSLATVLTKGTCVECVNGCVSIYLELRKIKGRKKCYFRFQIIQP